MVNTPVFNWIIYPRSSIVSLGWYLSSLKKFSSHKYNNWTGTILGNTSPNFDLSVLFLVYSIFLIILVVLWGYTVVEVYRCEFHEELITKKNRWKYYLIGPALGVVFEIFILLNFLSQSPYFVVSEVSKGVKGLDVGVSVNQYADIIDIYALTVFGFFPLIIAFATLLYFIYTGRIGGEYEFRGRVASKLE